MRVCTHACVHASLRALMCELWGLCVSAVWGKRKEKESLQQPNHNQAETPHAAQDHSLKYTKLIFKFYFVLALSNWQNCLGEPSKGQGELKCLLYGSSRTEPVS